MRTLESCRTPHNQVTLLGLWSTGRILDALPAACLTEDLLQSIADALAQKGLLGMSVRKIMACRTFYRNWPDRTYLESGLCWTHFQRLQRISNQEQKMYYLRRATHEHWSVRELDRQIRVRTYEREVDFAGMKKHYVFEYARVDSERDLEDHLCNQLATTMLELGPSLAFVGRQKRLVIPSGKAFFLDLVFYHTRRKIYLLVELKKGELTHRDLGQMDTYLRLYDHYYRKPDDGPTHGVILCQYWDENFRQFSLLADHSRLFVSTYSITI